MAGRIRDESIAEVRAATDIVVLVGEYVALRPAGGTRMKGLCPFHQEKTPSFTVDSSRVHFHCLAGETRVLTADGVRPISELAGGTHRILGRNGMWIEAPFSSFGVQPLMRIEVTRNGQRKELFATPEHRWFVRSGRDQSKEREVVTRDLHPGQRLVWRFPWASVRRTTPSPFGIAHGITYGDYGDGSRDGSGSKAYLAPGKDAQLLKWFPNSEATQRADQVLVIRHLPAYFKQLPPLNESDSYLYGFLAGYLAADGHVSKDGTVMLNCASRKTLEYVRAICTRLGIGTYGVTEQVTEGFPGGRPSSISRIHFLNEDLTEACFLLDQHRFRFASARKLFARRGWVVQSVEPTDRVEEVFCAVVDDGHAFVLEDNILTSNCFGCSEGGDAIDFLQKHGSLSFTEAVERLAQRAGIELRYEGRSAGERGSLGRKSRLVGAHAEAVDFYHRTLLESPDARPARDYLRSRALDRKTAERFRLGWAPADSWEALVTHLRGKGFRPEELTEAGLARTGSRGLRDAFHARVLFPIFDVAGDPVAFGGRLLADGGDQPKYVNTSETPVWLKGRVLYGLNWAKGPIVRSGFAVVVEGYTDVIACHNAGVDQAVATCGTALRADHFKLLSRFTERVVLAFDADSAGSKAAERGIGELVAAPEASLSAHVLTMPAGQDPADFVTARGGDAFRELLAEARPLVRWWLDWRLAQFDLRHPEGKARAARELLPVLRTIPDSLQRTEYARSVVQRLHLDDREYLAMVAGQRPTITVEMRQRTPPRSRSPQARVECEALKFALQHPVWTAEIAERWEDDWFTTPATKGSFAALSKAGGPGVPLDAVLDAAANEVERKFLRGLAVEAFAAEEDRGYADEVFRRLEEFRLTRVIDLLKGTLQRMNPVERPDEYTRFFEELIALEARRRALKEPRSGGEDPPPTRTT